MAVGGLGRPWVTLKRLLRVFALSQAVCPLVACLVVALASGLQATTVDTSSSETRPLESSTSTLQLPPVRRGDSQCCEEERARCPRDYPGPTRVQLSRHCGNPEVACGDLPQLCLNCTCDYGCQYGRQSTASCSVWGWSEEEDSLNQLVQCQGNRSSIQRQFTCSYCYLTAGEGHTCSTRDLGCRSVGSPTSHHHWYIANCTTGPNLLCLGKQVFSKRVECNWTEGYSWRTAVVLSVTLGGFGADRFYLGHWQEGIGKLFSFGGLGVWTLVDVVLVAIGYIGPADGSLYMDS